MSDLSQLRPHTPQCPSLQNDLTDEDRDVYGCNCGAFSPLSEEDVRAIVRDELSKQT